MRKSKIFHFWFDCETTGLNVNKDHVLEIAWTITDDNFVMLTPLRQRYVHFGLEFDGDWLELSPGVRDMHAVSGLTEDWDNAPALSKITNPQSMDRLFADDLVAVGFDPTRREDYDGDKLVLSGAGVSHFDNHVLYEHVPFFYPRETGHDGYWAYWRTFDTSTLWRGLGDKFMTEIRNAAFKAFDSDGPYSILECEQPGPVGDTAKVRHLMRNDVGSQFVFVPDAIIKHRAADDVVESLLTARAVRALPSLRLL